ncbi:MAG TPA: hypothetical protein VL334_18420 [Anaerolineae bacterium]|nr:hypothetical protein [Anaerolineae bacterium]
MSHLHTAPHRRIWLRISRGLTLALLLAFLAVVAGPALAQDYFFAVPKVQFQVFIEPDGAARLVYDLTFENEPSGRALDVVDIGLPTADYTISNMRASIDGVELSDIRPSEFVKPGIEVHLADMWINPGDTGTLHFEATVPNLLFEDVTNRDYASFQITPTWFGEQYVSGLTDLQIAIHLPEGISPEAMLYQNEAFGQRVLFEDRAVALWEFPAIRLTEPNLVGVSFPSAGIGNVQRMSALDLAEQWFVGQPTLRLILGLLFLGIFTFIFVRLTGGTGWTLWFIAAAGLVYLFLRWPLSLLVAFLPLFALLFLVERKRRRRKLPYLPPIAQVEGGGIKRGLTAPEAAALLEMPLNKVLTLIIFGLLKKGVLRQTGEDPFAVEVIREFQAVHDKANLEQRQQVRKRPAQQAGIVLHTYEQRFLDTLEAKPDTPLHKIDFGEAMDWFLASVARRMKGFDLSDTQEYYQAIVRRAVEQAKAIPEIPAREQALDRDMEWILLDDGYPTVFNTPSYTYRPIWARPGGGGSSGGVLPSLPSGGGSRAFTPSFSNVASGFAGWTENTMGSLAAAISPSSLPSMAGKSGFVNLSGVDKATGDVFKALGSSSGSRSSGGGGCACAGCACACACAGGGR